MIFDKRTRPSGTDKLIWLRCQYCPAECLVPGADTDVVTCGRCTQGRRVADPDTLRAMKEEKKDDRPRTAR